LAPKKGLWPEKRVCDPKKEPLARRKRVSDGKKERNNKGRAVDPSAKHGGKLREKSFAFESFAKKRWG
jgi:hypothetical protein